MATNSTVAVPASLVRSLDTGLYNISGKPLLPNAAAADRVVLFTFPHAARVTSAHLKVPNTLGTGVTLKLQKNSGGTYTDMTATTTAVTAGVVTGAAIGPMDFAAGDTVEALVAGGTITPAAVEFDVIAMRAAG